MRDSGLFAEVMEQALTSGTLVRFRAEGRNDVRQLLVVH